MKAPAAAAPSWSYSGATGPEHWGELSPQYALCATGRNQTPVNLTDFAVVAHLAPIHFDYATKAVEIVNNGHAVDIRFAPGGRIEVEGHSFVLQGLHFHVPAEHRVNGKSYAMEGHFVNADKDGNLAVVGALYTTGDANAALAKIVSDLPARGAQKSLGGELTAADFLPTNRAYYYYNGSLTTPPCSEGVRWFVLTAPLSVSQSQAQAFMDAVGGPNNRPLQPINARRILVQRH